MLGSLFSNETYSSYWASFVVSDPDLGGASGTHSYYEPWICASLCSALVGLTGLLPVALLSDNVSDGKLRLMLSFGCGSMLSNVFLHLLPEAYQRLQYQKLDPEEFHWRHTEIGLWIVCGILAFTVLEMLARVSQASSSPEKNGKGEEIAMTGYLNLLANCADNFTHGLAVGGAFMVDTKTGFLTTGCILLHEIPHEIGDFAILMKAGFDAARAARLQLYTASVGIAGALLALRMDADHCTTWIIPFTCGGFVQIALVTVLPDLLKSETVEDFFVVLGGIVAGILVMVACSGI